MVEASLVYPVIVAVVLLCTGAMVWFCERTADASAMGMEVRAAAGAEAGTFLSECRDLAHFEMEKKEEFSIEKKTGIGGTVITAQASASFSDGVFTGSRWSTRYSLSQDCLCEAEILWRRNAGKELVS